MKWICNLFQETTMPKKTKLNSLNRSKKNFPDIISSLKEVPEKKEKKAQPKYYNMRMRKIIRI